MLGSAIFPSGLFGALNGASICCVLVVVSGTCRGDDALFGDVEALPTFLGDTTGPFFRGEGQGFFDDIVGLGFFPFSESGTDSFFGCVVLGLLCMGCGLGGLGGFQKDGSGGNRLFLRRLGLGGSVGFVACLLTFGLFLEDSGLDLEGDAERVGDEWVFFVRASLLPAVVPAILTANVSVLAGDAFLVGVVTFLSLRAGLLVLVGDAAPR